MHMHALVNLKQQGSWLLYIYAYISLYMPNFLPLRYEEAVKRFQSYHLTQETKEQIDLRLRELSSFGGPLFVKRSTVSLKYSTL